MSLLEVRDLKVHFKITRGILLDRQVGTVHAVDGVDLDIDRGTTLGVVGESGCGKTTLGRAILRLVDATSGSVRFDGEDVLGLSSKRMRKLRRRMQMVFQDPLGSLDPRQSIESIIAEPLRTHELEKSTRDVTRRVHDLLDAVGLPAAAANRYPHEFSGGQRQRIGIARALAVNPDLIIADEPVSALDVSIQAQIVNLLASLRDEFNMTYMVIAHDLAVVRYVSENVAVMYLGVIVEIAPSDDVYGKPLHPYTIALLSAIPIPDPTVEDTRERLLLPGDLPSPANPPAGCRFHTRCPYRQRTRCHDEVPELREMFPGHKVACHWAEQIHRGAIKPAASAFDPTATAQAEPA